MIHESSTALAAQEAHEGEEMRHLSPHHADHNNLEDQGQGHGSNNQHTAVPLPPILAAVERDATVGGLLNEQGQDVRKRQTSIDAEDARRKGSWRGKQLAGEASIQYDFGLKTFDYKIQALILGNDLVIYVAYIVAFCFFFLVDRDINNNYYFSRALKDPMTGSEIALLKQAKFFTDISEAEEWNRYVLDVMGNQCIDFQSYATGGGDFLGAARFRTQRVRDSSCQTNSAIIPSTMPDSAQQCYGEFSGTNQDDGTEVNRYNAVSRWAYKKCSTINGEGATITGLIATYDCGGYFFDVPWWAPVVDPVAASQPPYPTTIAQRLTRDLFESLYILPAVYNNPPFVDNLATRLVVIEFFQYQPALQTFLSVKLYLEQASGGLWIGNFQFRVFDVWTPSDAKKTVYDVFFLLFVLYYIFQFIQDLVRYRRKYKKTLAFFFDTWNVMEFTNLVIFMIMFGFRFAWISKCHEMKPNIEDLTFSGKYPGKLDVILDLYMMQVYLNSINTILVFLKMLKFFRLNDRLNVLTRTLAESQDSIIGVLFIFLLVVTAFAMTGHGLFGLGVWRFRSVDASFSTMLQMLVGQFDYDEMKNENRVLAGFFFWSFIILGLFCLLNFLIGVLMEAFAEVSNTRAILPLEKVLARTWEDWKRVLRPASIKAFFLNQIKGTSRGMLLAQALDQLTEYRKEIYPDEDDTPETAKQMMFQEMFFAAISPELTEKISQEYLDYVWSDLVYEWDMSKTAQEAIDAQKNLEMTTRGVDEAIGSHLKKIEGFSGRMTALEKQLALIVNHLEGNQGAATS